MKGQTNNPGGRPKKPQGEHHVKQTLSLHPEILAKLNRIAQSNHKTISQAAADLINAVPE